MYSKILGTGSYLPSQVRTNADLEKMVETSDEWIVARTGIKERRISAENETVADMAFYAAENAIEMAGIDKEDIDLIIVATTSSSHTFPSSACQVQGKLGIKGCPAFDLAAACSGFVYALSVADQHIKTGMCKNVLVIGADALSNLQRIVAIPRGDDTSVGDHGNVVRVAPGNGIIREWHRWVERSGICTVVGVVQFRQCSTEGWSGWTAAEEVHRVDQIAHRCVIPDVHAPTAVRKARGNQRYHFLGNHTPARVAHKRVELAQQRPQR